jgi:hypothetical protein
VVFGGTPLLLFLRSFEERSAGAEIERRRNDAAPHFPVFQGIDTNAQDGRECAVRNT